MKGRLIVAANSAWNIVNFRAGLIRGLQKAGYEVIVAAPRDLASDVRMAELEVEEVDILLDRSGRNPLADARLFLAYRRLMRQIRPQAFLGFTIKPNIYGCLAARSLGVPAIANVSGLGTAFANRSWLSNFVSSLYRVALKKAQVFFQNPDDQREFVDHGIVSEAPARILPGSGVDLERFSPVSLPEGGPIFLLVARLLVDKGVREFVAAAREVRTECPEARFQLLGPTDDDNPTAITGRELDSWVSEGVVEYLGVADDVRAAMGAATVIVLPSFYREGVPRSLLEGGAMGRPLIATDSPGCRELVVEKEGGIACEPRDVSSLANAMRRIIGMTAAEREQMGQAARRLIEERFSEERVVEAYLAALAGIAAEADAVG